MTPWQKKRAARIARQRFERHLAELGRLADWKESLELRIRASQYLLGHGLPEPHFDCLEAEVVEFSNACRKVAVRKSEKSLAKNRDVMA